MIENVSDGEAVAYATAMEERRVKRAEDVSGPGGWLAAAALSPLHIGVNTVGASPSCDVHLENGPDHLATVTLDEAGRIVVMETGTGAATEQVGVVLRPAQDQASLVTWLAGHEFQVMTFAGQPHLRLKQAAHPARRNFGGLHYFPLDLSWRITALWKRLDAPLQMPLANVWGGVDQITVTETAVFERDGATHILYPTHRKGDQVVFIFGDKTTGVTTNRTGRFLFCDLPRKGEIVLDFNTALNPPSAFTHYATCPIAPLGNRLTLAVTAGEQRYIPLEENGEPG